MLAKLVFCKDKRPDIAHDFENMRYHLIALNMTVVLENISGRVTQIRCVGKIPSNAFVAVANLMIGMVGHVSQFPKNGFPV